MLVFTMTPTMINMLNWCRGVGHTVQPRAAAALCCTYCRALGPDSCSSHGADAAQHCGKQVSRPFTCVCRDADVGHCGYEFMSMGRKEKTTLLSMSKEKSMVNLSFPLA